MQQTPLWAEWDIRHVTTHRNGSIAAKILVFIWGTGVFVWELVVRRPRAVHLHMASYGSFGRKSILTWISGVAGVPVIIHVHGGEFYRFFERAPLLLQKYIRATLNHASVVIALGDRWARRLQLIAPGTRIVVIPNAVRPRTLVDQPAAGEPVQVLFLGDIVDHKGAFILLDSWKEVAETCTHRPGARLVLAGDGEVARARHCIDELEIDDCVNVLGWVPPAQAEELLRNSHILVLPSRNEGQPMAVLEAMANGLCVVATNVGGIPDLLDADSGVLVPSNDGQALVEALRRVIENDQERTALGTQALNRVRERFNVDITWRALNILYQELGR